MAVFFHPEVQSLPHFLQTWPPSTTADPRVSWIYVSNAAAAATEEEARVDSVGLATAWSSLCLSRNGAVSCTDLVALALEYNALCGKWLIFSASSSVDMDWAKVAEGVTSGLLGVSAKVAPRKPGHHNHVICVYTKNYLDIGPVGSGCSDDQQAGIYILKASHDLELLSRHSYGDTGDGIGAMSESGDVEWERPNGEIVDLDAALWSQLPLKIVEQVLLLLPVPDLCSRYARVCKKWHHLIGSPTFATTYARNSNHRGRDASFIAMHYPREDLWCLLDLTARRWYTVDDMSRFGFDSAVEAMAGGLLCRFSNTNPQDISVVVHNLVGYTLKRLPTVTRRQRSLFDPKPHMVVDSMS